jgi:DNA-binding protein HU-beta
MTKAELIEKLAEKLELSKAKTNEVLTTVVDTIKESLENNEKVPLTGFGTVETVVRPARTGRNPQTGEALQIPERRAVKFKSSGTFTDSLNHKN